MSDSGKVRLKLRQAGYRRLTPLYVFVFFRFVAPFFVVFISFFYISLIFTQMPLLTQLGVSIVIAVLSSFLPYLVVINSAKKRQTDLSRAFPDALDLLLICVESGVSIEIAFSRVGKEIGPQSVPLAEELALTTAELSYLQNRRMAYENLSQRTNLSVVRGVCVSLIQAERYGTPISQVLRTLAQEGREQRAQEAERKAAALPPKLTVPMMLFFMPTLFMILLGPIWISISDSFF